MGGGCATCGLATELFEVAAPRAHQCQVQPARSAGSRVEILKALAFKYSAPMPSLDQNPRPADHRDSDGREINEPENANLTRKRADRFGPTLTATEFAERPCATSPPRHSAR
jgi:hypothetical protein